MEKEPVMALDSTYLRHRLSREVLSRNLVGHPHENTFDESIYDFISLYSAYADL